MAQQVWGKIIEQLMKDRGMVQRELARESGVGRSALRRAVAGEGSPSLDTLEKIMAALKYEIDAIPMEQPAVKTPANTPEHEQPCP